MLAKLNKFLPTNILKLIYFSLIHSRLSYLTVLWASARPIYRRPLEIIQNRALKRAMKKNNRTNTVELYQSAAVLPLRGIRDVQLGECVFEHLNGTNNEQTSIEFSFPSHTFPRRAQPLLRIPRVRRFFGTSSINFRGASLYNKLIQNSVQLNANVNKSKLKSELKEIMLNVNVLENLVY